MKTRNIFRALAALILVIPMQSCLFEQEDIFEDAPSARIEKYLNNVQDILTDGEATWIMEYYPGVTTKYGGYVYVLKFTDEDVTVYSELDPTMECTSLYKLKADNSPVISFDTYNELLHYFATPSSTLYEAYGGDFEFSILDYSADKVTLLGKRSGNRYYLLPFDSKYTPKEYCAAVKDMTESFCASSLEGKIDDLDVTGEVDLDNRTLNLYYNGGVDEEGNDVVEKVSEMFTFTPTGMHFYAPFEINGYIVRDLYYLPTHNSLSNGAIKLYGKLPEGYKPITAFEGDFTLYYGSSKANITLTLNDDKSTFSLSGLIADHPLTAQYDKSKGILKLTTQVIGQVGNVTAKWCPLDSSAGYLTWTEGAGVNIKWSENDGYFTIENNGVWEGYTVDSFIIWGFDSSGTSAGECKDLGNSRFFELKYMMPR